MPKKIIIYINSLNAAGGIERITTQLINEWVKHYDIKVITKDEGSCFFAIPKEVAILSIHTPRHLNMNNKLQRIWCTFINTIKSVYKMKVALQNEDYDYLYVTTPLNALEAIFSGIPGNKIIVSEHGSAYGINKIYKVIKKLVYPKIRIITVPNKMDTDYYNSNGYHAVYIPHIVNRTNTIMNGLSSKIILNVGRLTADKRQSLLIESWSKIPEKNGWSLWIVGDGEEKEALTTLISKLGLNDTVTLLPATKQIDKIYRKASIFAFSSRYEGFGLVLLEAMSYGIPCISFDCPSGPRDIVIDGNNGYLVQNNNMEEYVKKMNILIHMKNTELRQMGVQAYTFAQNWNNENIICLWDKVFE